MIQWFQRLQLFVRYLIATVILFFFFPYTHTFILKYVQYVNYWIKTLKQLFHFHDNHYI